MIRDSPFELPTFNGLTIDKRLRQFRKVSKGCQIEFIEFDSKRGKDLLREMKDYFSFLEEEN
jgi:hypothetical protein